MKTSGHPTDQRSSGTPGHRPAGRWRLPLTAVAALGVALLPACADDPSPGRPEATGRPTSTIPSTTPSAPSGTGAPATGTPATGTPATGTPATGTPATGTPAAVTLTDLGVTLDAPTALVARPGDEGLYVAERAGRIVRLEPAADGSATEDATVVDLTAEVGSTDVEKGLLGLAFSPDGATLYASYTRSEDGASVIRSLPVTGNTADPAAGQDILIVDQPHPNHNGGGIVVTADGMLWFGLGDGGAANDPDGNGQDTTTLLGSLLRITPTPGSDNPYEIPPDNPFVGASTGSRPEIWAYGLRNPWRFSFDAETGDLWIGDVGQGEWEEIDFLPRSEGQGRGANLGWNLREGAHPFVDGPNPTEESAELVDPVWEYSHDHSCSVVGGFVYRGSAIPGLVGRYVYGDYCDPQLRSLSGAATGTVTDAGLGVEVEQLASFGEGPDRELYALSLDTGRIHRLAPA